ncbi:MAG: hypothetical protein ACPLZF_02015 [Nitrososphaeria archaeon]
MNNIVKIRLKRGSWEVEVECDEEKVAEVVSKVLGSFEGTVQGSSVHEGKDFGGVTCRGLLERMWREGWFMVSRRLSEVDEELARRGYHYDRSAISHALTDLVREGVLTREGEPRNYHYVQKKPPV